MCKTGNLNDHLSLEQTNVLIGNLSIIIDFQILSFKSLLHRNNSKSLLAPNRVPTAVVVCACCQTRNLSRGRKVSLLDPLYTLQSAFKAARHMGLRSLST